MNILELKRRLLPYSGCMKPAEDDGQPGPGSTAADELDLGNDDLSSTATSETAPPAPAPAPAAASTPASDASSGEGSGGTQNVPYARFREVNENKRLLEEQLAAMQQEVQALKAGQQQPQATSPAAAPAPAAFDVDAAEEQYAQALLDGDTKAASGIRREINKHIEDAALQRLEQATLQNQSAAKSQDVAANALAAYPWLDEPEGAEALELIEAAVIAKVGAGVPHPLALAQAIASIAPRFAPDGTPSRVLPNGGAPVDTRLERANKRGAADSLLQPAAVQAGMGNRATAPKIDGNTKLTEEQIAGASKAELDAALGQA
ncbi:MULTISPECIES: hypothetical protein [unclassified Acidovorax]|uniref:hypothetical protein n=1 Tax=unclassified Acidovorax TaxID=2684926 RepID=UPI001C44FEB0|nr:MULTISPECIES: hypothetical protein [unclassified Acidovorax]MBV7428059.1 hypothetical protein [Acidovorax sp. sif0732]MBV7449316.1 hypothetical protein [Acidovorax sp. sif0715]